MTLLVYILLTVLGGGFAYIIVPHIFRRRKTAEIDRFCRENRVVSLTYDDGPGKELTAQLLHLLEKEGVLATFFVLGHRADAAPSTVKKCLHAGHDVGSHTYRHYHAWKAFPWKCSSDIATGQVAVHQLGGDGDLFRPTYGKLNLWTLVFVLRRKFKLAWWTIDTGDSQEDPKSVDSVLTEIDSKGGGVVLMHDFDQYKTGDHIEYVLTMTCAIIDHARRNNMKLLPLSEIVDRPTGN